MMTNERAIKLLKLLQEPNVNLPQLGYKSYDPFIEAIDIGIDAIDKLDRYQRAVRENT